VFIRLFFLFWSFVLIFRNCSEVEENSPI